MSQALALFLPTLHAGGVERVMLSLARGFADRGQKVDLVLAQAEGELLGEVPEGVRLIDLGAPRIVLSLMGLVRYIRAEQPCALLSAPKHANVLALFARALACTPTRVVVSEHTTPSQSAMFESNWRGRYMLPWLMWATYPRADRVVAVSRGVADDLVRATRLTRDRIAVIYNPAMTPTMLSLSRHPIDHPWFHPAEPPTVLGVGRLTKAKDFSTLIRAFAVLRARRATRLVILGEGEERCSLETLIRELGLEEEVSLPGFVANPYAYMRNAAVFALSSRWEGFGLVLAEALACGTRVVSTDCPSGPAEILEGGRWGRLVPVGDAPHLAEAIEAALEDSAPPRVAARLEAFSLERAIDGYFDVLLGDRRSKPADAAPAVLPCTDNTDPSG